MPRHIVWLLLRFEIEPVKDHSKTEKICNESSCNENFDENRLKNVQKIGIQLFFLWEFILFCVIKLQKTLENTLTTMNFQCRKKTVFDKNGFSLTFRPPKVRYRYLETNSTQNTLIFQAPILRNGPGKPPKNYFHEKICFFGITNLWKNLDFK